MPMDIEQKIIEAIQESERDLNTTIYEMLGGGFGDVEIDVNYGNGNYTVSVNNINEYQMYNKTGLTMDDVLDSIETCVLDNINKKLRSSGY